ncbi:MAG TPA: glycerol-3-phosphate dehydrogenase/oxidase [Acidimicrobiia bacterium]|nr:glycerol-3-phosphate dehydrogenase/oxidase [Acidimicrobiia bacterium]
MQSSALGPVQRAEDLNRMSNEVFDIVVIGGGVTGAGTALDAATRGLSVALVEQRDYASGTSSRSSKLIHGGLRYLEQMDFGLVREALRERGLIFDRLAPHLVRPVSFLYPLRHRVWERAYVGAGIAIYDGLAALARNPLPTHRHLSRRGALKLAPALSGDGLVGAIRYWDAQVDDARHTLGLARTARAYGATLASSARVTGLLRDGDRVCGVQVLDLETGESLDVRARQVINATGVWTDEIQDMAGRGTIEVRASKGIHLVVPRDRLHSDSGLILRTATSVLFVIPWGKHWIIGTTDTDWNLDLAHPAASRNDIDYLLSRVNSVLDQPLEREDVEGIYAGLRPLLYGESEATSKLTREHAVSQTVPGLISVAGGKYTTYRVMAADAVDAAARNLAGRIPPSCTAEIPLVGADGFRPAWNRRFKTAAEWGLTTSQTENLLRRHGTNLDEVLSMLKERPDLSSTLPGSEDYLAVEVTYAARFEGALHLDDVLTRRTRLSIESWDRGMAATKQVAELMGSELGWDEETISREIQHYEARVKAERESQEQPDDHTADAARLGAPDVRMLGRV